MAYTNIAWDIFTECRTNLLANIPDIVIENRYRFPGEGDDMAFLGKFNRAALFRLDTDDKVDQANDCRDYEYLFQVQIVIIDTAENQQAIMDISEQVKYWLYQNQTGATNWYNCEVSPVVYEAPDLPTNIRKSEFSVRFYDRG